ncbi:MULTISPECIES: hypothetical protein [Sphingomonadales]|uniref:hypothetical protein n=1 Tax=Sphingomonadales TaxID=204457 RepID=UPI0002C052BE|nr:hypothetical protein [Sphingopyxis sp. DBS4]AGH51878.1 hypothetical protein G432_20995 [Sphingomonas sp. MM-1]
MRSGALVRLPALILAGLPVAAAAEPTDLVIRVISEGGKFVGTSMGGAEIIVRDVRSGEVLVHGRTAGSTGDTARIMKGGPRGTPLADETAAAFRTTIDIDEPRLVEVEAYGPLAQPQAAVRVTSQRWVLPGRGATQGDGWLLELPGLVVDLVEPAAHQRGTAGAAIRLAANVALMCGCPIEPGGIWDAARYDVRASAKRDGQPAGEVSLSYGGRTGYFTGTLPVDKAGAHVITVTAVDTKTGATGVDASSILIP